MLAHLSGKPTGRTYEQCLRKRGLKQEYNEVRPDSALGYLTSEELARKTAEEGRGKDAADKFQPADFPERLEDPAGFALPRTAVHLSTRNFHDWLDQKGGQVNRLGH